MFYTNIIRPCLDCSPLFKVSSSSNMAYVPAVSRFYDALTHIHIRAISAYMLIYACSSFKLGN